MNGYVERVLNETREKNSNEPEFLQTVEEVLTSLEPVIQAHPEYEGVRCEESRTRAVFRGSHCGSVSAVCLRHALDRRNHCCERRRNYRSDGGYGGRAESQNDL